MVAIPLAALLDHLRVSAELVCEQTLSSQRPCNIVAFEYLYQNISSLMQQQIEKIRRVFFLRVYFFAPVFHVAGR